MAQERDTNEDAASTSAAGQPPPSTAAQEISHEQAAAAMALLRAISEQQLPLNLMLDEEFEPLALLARCGYVNATAQLVWCQWSILPCLAFVVSEITPSGWAVLSLDSPHTASASSVA